MKTIPVIKTDRSGRKDVKESWRAYAGIRIIVGFWLDTARMALGRIHAQTVDLARRASAISAKGTINGGLFTR
jgi:hypothetical protein